MMSHDVLYMCILLQSVPAALYTDPNEIAQHLNLRLTECEKLEFPVMLPQKHDKEVLQ